VPEATESPFAAYLRDFLEHIPGEDRNPVSLDELCHRAGVPAEHAVVYGEAILSLLSIFGVCRTGVDAAGARTVAAGSKYAEYFLKSLRAHLLEDLTILHDWGRHAAPEGPLDASDMLKGPQFLYAIERRRGLSTQSIDPIPLRETSVSQVVIKAKVRGRGTCYLMQYNDTAQMYQLIGGHVRHDDASTEEAARREVAEELPRNVFEFGHRDGLTKIADVERVLMSRTIGVNTRYRFTLFHVRFGFSALRLRPEIDRWVTEAEIAQGRTRSGATIATEWYNIVGDSIPGGLRKLDHSFADSQAVALAEVIRARPWEFAGIVLAVVGIVLAVVQLYLT
jgi:NUDIX domain-containing protein